MLKALADSTIGFIGTGVMGASMASHLLNANYPLHIYSRTRSKAEPLLDAGAIWQETPKAIAENSDIVVTIVGFPADVEQVILDEETGVLAGLSEGSILIDCTTSDPHLAEHIHEEARKKSVHFIDAPVSGGDVGARNAGLTIFCGGEQEVVDHVTPLLEKFGPSINHMGPAGAGSHCKMSNQIFIASGMIALCEGLLYAQKAGLDLPSVIHACSGGAAGSWSLANYGPRILKRDFAPGFFVKHFLKDLGIALESANRMKLNLPGTSMAKMLYEMLRTYDLDNLGTQALILALEKVNNCELSKYDDDDAESL